MNPVFSVLGVSGAQERCWGGVHAMLTVSSRAQVSESPSFVMEAVPSPIKSEGPFATADLREEDVKERFRLVVSIFSHPSIVLTSPDSTYWSVGFLFAV